MSVTTAACMIFTLLTFYCFGNETIFFISIINVSFMIVLWTAYATTIKAAPAPWLHPFRRPNPGEGGEEGDNDIEEDLVMSELSPSILQHNKV